MSDGTKGTPGMPTQTNLSSMNIFDNLKQGQAGINTATTPQNIFELIKASASQSYSSVLPYVQAQMGIKSQAAEPQAAKIRQGGEYAAAMAQSDAGARGLRGSDIEAAGMAGARSESLDREAQFRSQIAMQEAQFMAESILKTYGYDIEQNSQMYNNLAQAIGQELSQQRELEMREKELKEAKKMAKKNSKMQFWTGLMQTGGAVAGGFLGPMGAAAGAKVGEAAAKKTGPN